MKSFTYVFLILTLYFFIGFCGCDNETEVGSPPRHGSIDATTYVSIGSNLTAGYASGALYQSAQMYSYPNLIARQLGTVEFNQPIMPDPGTGTRITLQSLNPVSLVTGSPTQVSPTDATTLTKPYHNLGIPGGILFDVLDTSSITQRSLDRKNPFYLMIMRNQTLFGKNLVEQATKLKPTLITVWMGNNDVLGYAASGGVRGTNVGLGGVPPQTLPTEGLLFKQWYETALGLLKQLNPDAKIIVCNIPDPTDAPYFTTVPIRIPNPQDPSIQLPIYYKKNDNSVVMAQQGDLILLPAQTELAKGVGLSSQFPLSSQYVLDTDELQIAQNAVSEFNQIILTAAAKDNIPVFYAKEFLQKVRTEGFHIAGETFNADFITGRVFSLDGIHLSAKGNGLIANRIIQIMNEEYGANIPYVILSNLPGIPGPVVKKMEKLRYSLAMKIPVGLERSVLAESSN